MNAVPDQQECAPAEKPTCPLSGFYDEVEETAGTVRPHWRSFIQSMQRWGSEELASRSQHGRRLIREHGVTYTVYGDPKGMDRPWGLDLVPFLITDAEWQKLEAGLVQRSRLLNLILADIYGGSQRLLRDGFLPAELIYADPAFLRPCRGIQSPAGIYLHVHACDLGRSPEGQWWVLSDRTQAPGGAGYAWENRSVLSRLLPDEIRENHVQPIGSFFRHLREMLCNLAPPSRHRPSVVLLTPGPHHETYFEHAYLARHLGFPLVEGADLTVRDRGVYLKTVEGLQPVHVILRRVADSLCDPLELRGDSLLGIAGLVDAARAGKVILANGLGAGLLESAALLEFLPALCRHLLDEDLLLPSIPSWWCGRPDGLRYADAHLDDLIIKPAFGSYGQPVPSAGPSPGDRPHGADARRSLRDMLHALPHQFVAQQRMQLSRAPAWADTQLISRPIVMRSFVAQGTDTVAVLPGGLTWISQEGDELLISLQTGGGSKDTWVLSNGAPQRAEPAPLLAEARPAEHVLSGVPSRAADHLFWLGRYTERLEQLLRVLRCVLGRVSGEPEGADASERSGLNQLAVHLDLYRGVPEPSSCELSERMLALLYGAHEADGVRELVGRIRTTASAVRDRFSNDTWRILGRLDQDADTSPGRLPLADAGALIHDLVLDLAAFSGMEMENMTRGRGWRFLDLGRRLERGASVVKLLQAAASVVGEPAIVLEPVLEIADSLMTYRRLFLDRPCWPGVLAVVLRDESNPRSLAFQLQVLAEHAGALVGDKEDTTVQILRTRIQALSKSLPSLEWSAVAGPDATQALPGLLNLWGTHLAEFSDEITNRYFSHSISRQS